MASVDLIEVNKSFGGQRIVEDLSLSVADGELLVLVGPSGCGKSTCLRLIAGLETVDDGSIMIGDRVVNDLSPRERDIGMVFQSYALYPHMSVFENMAFGLRMRKHPAAQIESQVRDVARSLELSELLERRPGQLSGGQRQRVAMGRAIVRRPQVFLFDEPLSNLDAALRVQMRAELASLHRRHGTTTIYVTHDQVEAMTLGDRIAVLKDGVLQQVAAPLELYQRPANQFVAGFIGNPAMNFLRGHLASQKRVLRLHGSDLEVPLPENLSVNLNLADGDGVILGVRPHDACLGDVGVEAVIEVVEPMGWDAFVHCRIVDQAVVVRVPGDRAASFKPGECARMRLDVRAAYLFDERGATLSCPQPERLAEASY